jgi:undecaprenyl-diphosphatase
MFTQILTSLALGAVEGITEFLPISSTGHLILVNQWLTFDESFTKIFDVAIQLGAILAAVVFFWGTLWPFGKPAPEQKEIFGLWKKALIGVLPAIVIGAAFGSRIQAALFNPWVVAGALMVGGLILLVVERKNLKPRFDSVAALPWTTALAIGLIQCLSMIPGTSRSAATIIGAMLLGVSRTVAVEFSFFLAIPTMVAATGYSLLKHGSSFTASEGILLGIGFLSAFGVALAVIRLFIAYIQRHSFVPFAYYRLVLGALVFLYFLVR